MSICTRCSSPLLELEEKCPTCGAYVGAPNVRAAEQDEEVDALNRRYVDAIQRANANGRELAVMEFDESVKQAFAVVNVDLDFLRQFITNDKLIYSNYELSVRGQLRKPAKSADDRQRRTVGAMLHGNYAEQIRYAALSLDGSGLASWGQYAMRLREIAIIDRASLLEDNSYNFIPKHNLEPGGEIPAGYVAAWPERHKLAVAKLSEQIAAGTTAGAHSRILLSSTGNRATDECLEVHIYGGFDNKAVESVKGSSSVKGKWEQATISIIKDYLTNAGKSWVEE
jgi:hypothetical protein